MGMLVSQRKYLQNERNTRINVTYLWIARLIPELQRINDSRVAADETAIFDNY